MKKMPNGMVIALTRFAIFLIAGGTGAVWAETGKVTRVTDGDTLWVRLAEGGKPVRVRIDGIDAPEICQAGGRAARVALASRVASRTVTLVIRRHDDYGRAVASVHVGGEDIAGWMVGRGHAWSYHYGREGGPYLKLQGQAQAAGKGLFADPHALAPRLFRKLHGSCHP